MLLLLMATITSCIKCLHYPIIIFFLLLSSPILYCDASDCLEEGSKLQLGSSNSTLISPHGVFEFGFFTPDENNNSGWYLGIWYYNQSNPKIIVWVANRDEPLLESNGSLVVEDGTGKLLNTKGVPYWSTNATASGNDLNLCLLDNGNLVLKNKREGNHFQGQNYQVQLFWQSFDYPSDTFLPGMDVAHSSLTSWAASNNPAQGEYEFVLDLDEHNQNQLVILKNGSQNYWESEVTPFDKIPQRLFDLLLISFLEPDNKTRLVMNFTGQIQFWKRESVRSGWSLIWSGPNDRCSLINVCGNFGSCSTDDGLLCKCLPGFTPSSPRKWNSGNFSEGCSPRSASCSRDYLNDVFLRMPRMKVNNPDTNETTGVNCTVACLQDCSCVAYSCGHVNCTGLSNKKCLIWNSKLFDLQEDYSDGLTIFVRGTRSDIESTSRDCEPCGTYIIPYPLSTSAHCGDPSYFNFICNADTGQVTFSTFNGIFNVTSIDSEAKKFSIKVSHANWCNIKYIYSIVLSPEDSSQYSFRNCNVVKEQSFQEVEQSFTELEIGWKPPQEPACNASSDCQDWPNTTCKPAKSGGMRCFCQSKFHWDGRNLKCTKDATFPLKVVAASSAAALAIILLCGIFFIYHTRKRRLAEHQGSVEYKGEDTEGIDVPFYDWERILAATNNFTDTNKLGMGGFGSVYKGMLPDGQEIAVKRLSSVSVQGVEEFRTEVKLIAKLQHRNLVRLIGYCMKADEKILVYEYMPNGSLDSCLFDEMHCVDLDWKKRFQIVLGIARGLLYLHHDSRLRIIHRDLKPSNILLDEELNPKISDFGIARIVGGKETQASTNRVVGTYGYMSPEYAYEGIFSVKSDVFSFGVVILETISGRRNSKTFMYEQGVSLLGYAWKLWNENKGLELMDPKLNESCIPSEVLKCIHIGLLCVQENPSDRPTMSTIALMLSNNENTSLPLAKQPAFMNTKRSSETASSSTAMDSSMQEVMTVSTVGR